MDEGRRAAEQVVARAPDLGPAHGLLAINLSNAVNRATPSEAAGLLARLKAEAAAAIRLSRHASGAAHDALFEAHLFEAPQDLVGGEDLLLKGMADDPDFPFLPMRECRFLINVGRFRDSQPHCARAIALGPLAAAIGYSNAASLFVNGQTGLAQQVIAKSARFHPDHLQTRRTRLQMAFADPDPTAFLAILRDAAQRPQDLQPQAVAALEAFAAARQHGGAGEKARALDLMAAAAAAHALQPRYLVMAQAMFGQIDAAFATLEGPLFKESAGVVALNGASSVLFDPSTAPLRRDPRYWRLVRRLGLIDYWKARGVWPDFCSDPAAGVDCKAAAAGV